MAAPITSQTSQLSLPGASSAALRTINARWHITDVADIIPYNLHPQNRHSSSTWSAAFQKELEAVSHVVRHSELTLFREKCHSTVENRCSVKPKSGQKVAKRATYLTVDDLKNIKRVFGHVRDTEMRRENEQLRAADEARVRARERDIREDMDAARGRDPLKVVRA
ncbi:hypothetical protein HBI23_156980 [Parastagonospora nodorum]|nr:hypothetical protein HBI79_143700 [Parastagonospora nodorum]KAH5412787.1 hypothetical protein HBI47_155460 [Parastagonospora nodorum]KAH5654112.1 hypothetical protein HBI23_156980 [Parastagonospora nodorum]